MKNGISAELAAWINKAKNASWFWLPDNTIVIRNDFYMNDFDIKKFPVHISSVDGKISVNCHKLISVEGFPSEYKELVIKGSFFPTKYYLEAIEQKKTLEEILLQYFSESEIKDQLENGFPEDDVYEIMKEFFPTLYYRFRGVAASKKFGI